MFGKEFQIEGQISYLVVISYLNPYNAVLIVLKCITHSLVI